MPSVKDRNEKFQDEEEDLVVVSQTYLSINAMEHLNINVSQSCINALLSTSAQLGQLGSDELSRRCKQKRLEERHERDVESGEACFQGAGLAGNGSMA